ncbi:MAG: class I SAM-dependent methyltransferase, partial [Eubacteriales bacterium]
LMKYKLPGCELAEIGGGIGQFSYLVKQAGYIQTTFELSEAICDWGRQNLNVVMHQGEISDINKEYEVIVSFDVLEHITEPKLFITQCLKHLKHSGVLCIQTPCFSNQNVSDKSNRFRQLLIKDEHVFLYSRKSIQLLLEEAGLKYFQFEPAVFGDDYDMFLFASREPMIKNTDKEIDEYLNSIEPGRLLKSMMSLYHDVNEKEHVINELVRYKEYLEEERLMQRFTRKRKNKR